MVGTVPRAPPSWVATRPWGADQAPILHPVVRKSKRKAPVSSVGGRASGVAGTPGRRGGAVPRLPGARAGRVRGSVGPRVQRAGADAGLDPGAAPGAADLSPHGPPGRAGRRDVVDVRDAGLALVPDPGRCVLIRDPGVPGGRAAGECHRRGPPAGPTAGDVRPVDELPPPGV